jgi:hypothetical protein
MDPIGPGQTITFTNCTFTENESFQTPGLGAIINAQQTSVKFIQSTFKLNKASVEGIFLLINRSIQ